MTKGEKFELVFKRVYYMGVFLLSYNSCSSKVFDLPSCKLKSYGGLILFDRFPHAYFLSTLMHACWVSSDTILHRAFQILHTICQMRVWIARYRGEISMILLYNVHLLFKANSSNMHIFRGSSSISCNQIPQYQYLHFICLSPLKT